MIGIDRPALHAAGCFCAPGALVEARRRARREHELVAEMHEARRVQSRDRSRHALVTRLAFREGFSTLTERGGVAPPPRRRSRLAPTLPEREEISRGLAAGESARGARRAGPKPASLGGP